MPSDVLAAALIHSLRYDFRASIIEDEDRIGIGILLLQSIGREKVVATQAGVPDKVTTRGQWRDVIDVLEAAAKRYGANTLIEMLPKQNLPLDIYEWFLDYFELTLLDEGALIRLFFNSRTEWNEIRDVLGGPSSELRTGLINYILAYAADNSIPTEIIYLAQTRYIEQPGTPAEASRTRKLRLTSPKPTWSQKPGILNTKLFTHTIQILAERNAWSEIHQLVSLYRVMVDQFRSHGKHYEAVTGAWMHVNFTLIAYYNQALNRALREKDWTSVYAILENSRTEGIDVERAKVLRGADASTPIKVIQLAIDEPEDPSLYARALELVIAKGDWKAAKELHEQAKKQVLSQKEGDQAGIGRDSASIRDLVALGRRPKAALLSGIFLGVLEVYKRKMKEAIENQNWKDLRAILAIANDFYALDTRETFVAAINENYMLAIPPDILAWAAMNADSDDSAAAPFVHLLERGDFTNVNAVLRDARASKDVVRVDRLLHEIAKVYFLTDEDMVLRQLEKHEIARYIHPKLRENYLLEMLLAEWKQMQVGDRIRHLKADLHNNLKWHPLALPVSFITEIVEREQERLRPTIAGFGSVFAKEDPQGRLSVEDGKKGALTVVDEEAVEATSQESPQAEQAPSPGMFRKALSVVIGIFVKSGKLNFLRFMFN